MVKKFFNEQVRFRNKTISNFHEPFLLAEVAMSHEGKVDKIKYMIDKSSSSGFDGIQFQLFQFKNLLTPTHKYYNTGTKCEISYPEWKRLFEYARKKGLIISSNILEPSALIPSVEFGADVLKIHSSDIANPEFIKNITKTNLPVILATGGSKKSEILDAVALFKRFKCKNLLLMHGYQGYPTPIDKSNLKLIEKLKNEFKILVGFQDHVNAEDPMSHVLPMIALSKGASIIEKHITDNRSRKGTDYISSLDPSEFNDFVSIFKKSYLAMGHEEIGRLSKSELQYRKDFKKSIIASKNIKKNDLLTMQNLTFMRGNEIGFPPSFIGKILNKKAKFNINKYDVIKKKHY